FPIESRTSHLFLGAGTVLDVNGGSLGEASIRWNSTAVDHSVATSAGDVLATGHPQRFEDAVPRRYYIPTDSEAAIVDAVRSDADEIVKSFRSELVDTAELPLKHVTSAGVKWREAHRALNRAATVVRLKE